MAAVDKRSNQPVIEHHGNKAKLMACQARAETDRGALTMAKRARRRCCRPRGRKTSHGKIRRRQTTTTGWLVLQGVGEAIEHLAAMVEALRRRQTHDRAAAAAAGKQRKENGEERRRQRPYSVAQKRKEATQEPFLCQREAKDGHGDDQNASEAHRRCSLSGEHCSQNLQNCHLI